MAKHASTRAAQRYDRGVHEVYAEFFDFDGPTRTTVAVQGPPSAPADRDQKYRLQAFVAQAEPSEEE
jgi:hypothetical protein